MRKLIFILIALISFSQAQTIQYIGSPTTTVISKGNFRTDSIFYLPKRTKTPTDTAAFRYQISDSSLYYWTGYQWTKVQSASSFASVDTTVISTRAYRQKGDDSLGAIIATKGSGTVTSVATGYGLSGGTITTTGTISADTALMATRLRVGKVVDSLSLVKQNVLTNPVTGTGTTSYVPKFTATSTIGNSQIFDNGTNVGIGNNNPSVAKLQITGASGVGGSVLFQTERASGFGSTELFQYYNTGGTDYGSNFGINVSTATNGRASITFRGDAVAQTGQLIFNTNNTERARINAGGELLINTTTDAGAYTLQNNGALYNSGDISIRGTYSPVSATNRGNITLNGTASNIIAFANNSALRGYIFHTDSDFLFYNNTTGGRVGLYTEGTARLWIAANGNVGIGTTSPSLENNAAITELTISKSGNVPANVSTINLQGDRTLDAGSTSRVGTINFWQTTNNIARINGLRGGADNSGAIEFLTNNAGGGLTTRLFINPSGETLFGTTTDAGNYRVQVSGNAYISGILNIGDVGSEYINVTADQNSSVSTRIRNNNTGSSAYAMVGVNASGNSWGFRMGSSAANNNALEIVSNAFGTPVSRLNITTGGIVGIGTTSPNASSIVDISSTTGGFLPPRMTTTQRDAISSPAAGLVIYNTTTSKLQVYTTSWTDLH